MSNRIDINLEEHKSEEEDFECGDDADNQINYVSRNRMSHAGIGHQQEGGAAQDSGDLGDQNLSRIQKLDRFAT